MSDTIPAPPPALGPGLSWRAIQALTTSDPAEYAGAVGQDMAAHAITKGTLPAARPGEDFEAWVERCEVPPADEGEDFAEMFRGRYRRLPTDAEREWFASGYCLRAWDDCADPARGTP